MPAAFITSPKMPEASSPSTANRRASLKVLSRNIDQVVLGNLVFDTWYYSPYPDRLIVDAERRSNSKLDVNGDRLNGHDTGPANGGRDEPACSRLHVCPYCFSYSCDVIGYVVHLQHHAKAAQSEAEAGPVPESAVKVYEWDGYTVWEVDGEYEKLYCQNLSLFGKLFLEQKSVFFDTGAFHYYVLTFTPPGLTSPAHKPRGRKRASSNILDELDLRTHVLGFFSKENLSWDSNNLACILIFPPFQHRQLGQLLMAISYKMSGWEWEGGIVGGPEKPLSSMGRRSYLRFWSERIARFMMGQSADADGLRVFARSRRKKINFSKEEMTVKELGDRTGMLTEDVVAALNEMEVCERIAKRRKKQNHATPNGASGMLADHDESPQLTTMVVHRSKVLAWAKARGIDVDSPVKEEGFLGEWAPSDDSDELDEEASPHED